MAVKATVFLEDEQLDELLDLVERPDCPAVVVALVAEIEMWKEEA